MRVRMPPLWVLIFLSVSLLGNCKHNAAPEHSAEFASPESIKPDLLLAAIAEIKSLTDFGADDDLTPLIRPYKGADLKGLKGEALRKKILIDLALPKWGDGISSFIATAQLLYSFKDMSFQVQHRTAWDNAIKILEEQRLVVRELVRSQHPGFALLHSEKLRQKFRGKDIKIAVFDVFDTNLLEQQREHFRDANIEAVKNFGKPVSVNHGNSVIDIILEIAPEATILPVSADTAAYTEAFQFIGLQKDLFIVNMSRTFLEDKSGLDPEFAREMNALLSEKIVCKSLGNTGTDLDNKLSAARQEKGLRPLGSLFSYDLPLIKSYFQSTESKKNIAHLLLGINLNLLGEQVALSATVPGQYRDIQGQSLAIVADGIESFSTGNFESGSSFAAPQIAAVLALLLESTAQERQVAPAELLDDLVNAIKSSARPIAVGPEMSGLGLLDADAAWGLLKKK